MPNQIPAQPQNGDDPADVKTGLDAARAVTVQSSLGPVCLALGFLFALLAALNGLYPGWRTTWLALLAIITPVIYFSLYLAWRARRLRAVDAPPASALAAALALINCLVYSSGTGFPLQTAFLAVCMAAAGYLVLDFSWLLVVLAGGFIGWGWFAGRFFTFSQWVPFLIVLLLAALLSLLLRRVRMATIGQAETVRRMSARQQYELETLVQKRTADLQNAYDRLERMDRAKSDFINIASHELRTPLTVMKGYSQMLLDNAAVQQNEFLRNLASGIYGGTGRLAEIVNNLLDAAKIENQVLAIAPGPVILSSLVDFVLSGLSNSIAERRLIVQIVGLHDLPIIQADLNGLRKVFYHLVGNAIKYTPDGGKITISGRCLAEAQAGPGESAVEIMVADTGIGIDPAMHDLVFAKFYQTGAVSLHSTGKAKFKGGGPGLGLAIARGIVEAHGGRIWVESPGCDEDKCPGSQFHVVLPLVQKVESGLSDP
jgi:signal transduction histidine kinase